MHELSVAESILGLLPRLVPAGAVLRAVEVEAGPLRAIDPEAMDLAWRSATAGGALEGVKLNLRSLPYRLTCDRCGRSSESSEPYTPCACGGVGRFGGGAELRVVSLEVD